MTLTKQLFTATAVLGGLGFGLLGATTADAAEQYKVASGDTLSTISTKFAGDNSLINSIAANNGIANIDLIFVGQELTIDKDAQYVAPVETYTEPVYSETYVEPTYQEEYTEPTYTPQATSQSTGDTAWATQYSNGGHFTYYNANAEQGWGNGDWTADGTSTRTWNGRDKNGYLIVAADPSVPFGTIVETPWGQGVVHDRGGAIQGSGRYDVLQPN